MQGSLAGTGAVAAKTLTGATDALTGQVLFDDGSSTLSTVQLGILGSPTSGTCSVLGSVVKTS